jgi:ribose/xylose/arabinose/galactoside ABC-type transport system permease subunit
MRKLSVKDLSKPIILAAFFLILTILRPSSFLTIGNLGNVLWSVSIYGVMVSGTIFVFLLGGIDLSIGTLCGLTGVTCVMTVRAFGYSPAGVVAGILVALTVGLLAGLIHGLIITTFHVPAFLVTFATQTIYLGLSMILTNNKILDCTNPKLFTSIGKNPIPIILMVVAALISWYVLRKTETGRYVYAVGGNDQAAAISGISVRKITIMAYMISGFTTAIGGIILSSMTQQGMASNGSGYEQYVIMAGVIGGISLLGGEGTVPGAIFGAMIIGLLQNGLNLMSVPSTQHGLVRGLVIIAAVGFDALQRDTKFQSWLAKRRQAKAAGKSTA